ncbi:uncharacterized protein LOC115746498 [Rhodamnia argentea]|uniref:Uncharacterized protein LOC115746498 n=1 Tax=Rhodamnia argentea TaxID=178133 RepID=A0A8B8PTP4_9MYRT|nr:uncharacterized protein LOC115746498 [Rhodamnia argentea]
MEITTVNFHHRKSFKIDPRPLMLKDYLRDDMSSCSSNGFKSFPRRQCCTTVRFLLEIDLKAAPPSTPSKRRPRRSSSRSPATASVLQGASVKVLNAVKLLQFHSTKSPSGNVAKKSKVRSRKGLLPRSLSRKLWKWSFWKKTPRREGGGEEIGRRRSIEKRPPPSSDRNANSAIAPHRLSTSSSSSNNRQHSSSWDSSEFTAELVRCPSGDSEISARRNEVVLEDKGLERRGPHDEKVSDKVGATHGQDSITATPTCSKQEWPNEEKEQFSPVSVLDCPFKDDEDIASPFGWSPSRIGGAKQRPKHKARRCERLSRLKPVQLEKRIALSELEGESLVQHSSLTPSPSVLTEDQDGETEIEEKIRELLDATMGVNPSFVSKVDILLLDFFRERLEEEEGTNKIAIGGSSDELETELLKVADGWIKGQPQEVFLGWEVEDGRDAYIKDMERRERWRDVGEEKMGVALDLEVEVWSYVMDEVLLDIIFS